MKRRRIFSCAHCGADVPVAARACPECGSDDSTGWSEDATAWAGDLPTGYDDDDEFDEDEFLRSEGLAGDRQPSREEARRRRVSAVCLILVICCVLWWVLR